MKKKKSRFCSVETEGKDTWCSTFQPTYWKSIPKMYSLYFTTVIPSMN